MRKIIRFLPAVWLGLVGGSLALDNAAGTAPGLFSVVSVAFIAAFVFLDAMDRA